MEATNTKKAKFIQPKSVALSKDKKRVLIWLDDETIVSKPVKYFEKVLASARTSAETPSLTDAYQATVSNFPTNS